jgi:hypothetical protein
MIRHVYAAEVAGKGITEHINYKDIQRLFE